MASRNEATCDILANIKGSADAYAEGMEFVKNWPPEWVHDWNNARILATQAEADEVNAIPVPSAMRVIWKIGDDCPWIRMPLTPPTP